MPTDVTDLLTRRCGLLDEGIHVWCRWPLQGHTPFGNLLFDLDGADSAVLRWEARDAALLGELSSPKSTNQPSSQQKPHPISESLVWGSVCRSQYNNGNAVTRGSSKWGE